MTGARPGGQTDCGDGAGGPGATTGSSSQAPGSTATGSYKKWHRPAVRVARDRLLLGENVGQHRHVAGSSGSNQRGPAHTPIVTQPQHPRLAHIIRRLNESRETRPGFPDLVGLDNTTPRVGFGP
jgi:hypothetical protein